MPPPSPHPTTAAGQAHGSGASPLDGPAGPDGAHLDLLAEQAVVDAAYRHLDRMRAKTERLLADVRGGDPDLQWALSRRAQALAPTGRPLCFGRTDGTDGQSWYIGRRHVEDELGEPIVVEWRAPVAMPFYRATWSEPLGLERRRQFVVEGRRILFIGDDTFGLAPAQRGGDELRGRDALLVELERARTGEMLDIVATIQPEQDQVIRAPAPGVLAVQGGPGSGKTAVGLHRAAFLLYVDDEMARANVLVVGPNRTFLRYIAHVLPSLGESAVVQTTLGDLVPEVSTPGVSSTGRSVDGARVQRLKGDARMAEVLYRALRHKICHQPEDLEVALGLRRLRVSAPAVNEALDQAAARRVPYATGRDVFRDLLVRLLYERFVDLAGAPADGSQLGRTLRAAAPLKRAVDSRWPGVSPSSLVAELLSKPPALAVAGEGVLGPDEQASLFRRRGRAWSPADGPLVDEAKELVHGQSRTYGYAIVDEAQDLSPMELRMLARRCPGGAMTLLGDMAQAVGPWGARSWEDLAACLPGAEDVRVVELRYGYRSTAHVLDFAARLLAEAAPSVRPVSAVRPGRSAPSLQQVQPRALVSSVVEMAAHLCREYATVGVVVPGRLTAEVADAAIARLPSVGEATRDGLGQAVTVVAAHDVKGLEFDAVVVAEPSMIVAEGDDHTTGLRLLYVALTRPTQHLAVLFSDELPVALRSAARS